MRLPLRTLPKKWVINVLKLRYSVYSCCKGALFQWPTKSSSEKLAIIWKSRTVSISSRKLTIMKKVGQFWNHPENCQSTWKIWRVEIVWKIDNQLEKSRQFFPENWKSWDYLDSFKTGWKYLKLSSARGDPCLLVFDIAKLSLKCKNHPGKRSDRSL